jgi:hypothetical protein
MEEGLLLLANEILPCIFGIPLFWFGSIIVFLEMWRSLERLGSIIFLLFMVRVLDVNHVADVGARCGWCYLRGHVLGNLKLETIRCPLQAITTSRSFSGMKLPDYS